MKRLRTIKNFRTTFNNCDVILYLTRGVGVDALTARLRRERIDILTPMVDEDRRYIIIRDGRLLYVSDDGLASFTKRGYSVLQLHQCVNDFFVMMPEV